MSRPPNKCRLSEYVRRWLFSREANATLDGGVTLILRQRRHSSKPPILYIHPAPCGSSCCGFSQLIYVCRTSSLIKQQSLVLPHHTRQRSTRQRQRPPSRNLNPTSSAPHQTPFPAFSPHNQTPEDPPITNSKPQQWHQSGPFPSAVSAASSSQAS